MVGVEPPVVVTDARMREGLPQDGQNFLLGSLHTLISPHKTGISSGSTAKEQYLALKLT